jgi:hypothetical protein
VNVKMPQPENLEENLDKPGHPLFENESRKSRTPIDPGHPLIEDESWNPESGTPIVLLNAQTMGVLVCPP